MSTTAAGVVRVARLEGADLARLSYRVDSESGGGREGAGAGEGEGSRRSTGESGVWLRLQLSQLSVTVLGTCDLLHTLCCKSPSPVGSFRKHCLATRSHCRGTPCFAFVRLWLRVSASAPTPLRPSSSSRLPSSRRHISSAERRCA